MNTLRAGALALAALCITTAAATSPAHAADPTDWPDPGSAPADVIRSELQNQGYDVAINWVNNGVGVPLARCQVSGYHARGAVTTVYIDVVCPDED